MIRDIDKLKTELLHWVSETFQSAGKTSAIIRFDGSAEALLCCLLCSAKSILPIPVCAVDIYEKFNPIFQQLRLNLFTVDLANKLQKTIVTSEIISNDLSNIINVSITNNKLKDLKESIININRHDALHSRLESSITLSILNYMASMFDGLILGTLNVLEYSFLRNYDKYGQHMADLLPLADLLHSEIKELLRDIINGYNINEELKKQIISRYNELDYVIINTESVSTAELEQLFRENTITGIISNDLDPTKDRNWGRFTKRQRELISLLYQNEKHTRHKINITPVCSLRSSDLFVQ